MARLHVLSPGFMSSVQDLGRPGFSHLGVSASGAADPIALQLGDLLVGNEMNSAGLEMTLVGGSFQIETDTMIAITGAEIEPRLDNQAVPMWTSLRVREGQILHCGATRSGARAYVCIAGGFRVRPVLGSSSTHLMTHLGGYGGRALKKGDDLEVRDDLQLATRKLFRVSPELVDWWREQRTLRVTSGPQVDWFPEDEFHRFLESPYIVTEESDRMGLRLMGAPIKQRPNGDMLTEGVSLGAIQIPTNGQPIILFVEHQTTGGYPKIANVVLADIHRVGQLRPRHEVRFEQIDLDEAYTLLREMNARISAHSLLPA